MKAKKKVAGTGVTPPEYAQRRRISTNKVHSWIKTGELQPIDISTVRGGKPRYLIDEADIALFELKRSVVPPAKPSKRRKARPADSDVIECYK